MRLIDADALIKRAAMRGHCLRPLVTAYHMCVDVKDIEKSPTIDAVPVVRCKECIFRPTTKGDMYGTDVRFPYEGMCPLECEDPYYSQMMDGDFFCANGERRDDNA